MKQLHSLPNRRFTLIVLAAMTASVISAALVMLSLLSLPQAGFIDNTGNLIVSIPGLSDGGEFHDGLAPAKIEKGWGYINKKGEWIIPPQFSQARNFSEGLAAVKLSAKRFAYIDKTAHGVLEFPADFAGDFHEGVAMLAKDGKYGYINKRGQMVVPQVYWYVEPGKSIDSHQGVIPVNASKTTSASWTFIDHHNRPLFQKQFQNARQVSENLAPVCVATDEHSKRWGFINKEGSFVIPPEYLDATSFSEGLSVVEIANPDNSARRYTYIDHKNQRLTQEFSQARQFSQGLASVSSDAQEQFFGYINKEGNFVISPRFIQANKFSDGLAFTKRKPLSRLWWQSY